MQSQTTWISRLPGFAAWKRSMYDRRFESNRSENLFRGVFGSAEAALATAPTSGRTGYNNAESAAMYGVRTRPDAHDYPAMFWLGRAIEDGARTIFDVGGHIGLKFYAFSESLRYPSDLRWTVCDVHAVVEAGRRIARDREVEGRLGFTESYDDLSGMDVLFASGVLQYLPMTLPDWLGRLKGRPRSVVVNTTPLHHERDFYTLNSIGTGFCAYRVFHEASLIRATEALGYTVVDRWANVGKGLTIPFADGFDVPDYRGFYAVLR